MKKSTTFTTFTTTTLFWATIFLLVIITTLTSAQETYSCASLCPSNDTVVTNPDQTVTYDWNSRVPVPSSTVGETVQTFTCAEFDVRLTTFDESDCTKHQQGLQAAGCQCGGSSSSGSGAAANNNGMYSSLTTTLVTTVSGILVASVAAWL
jgi:hypothetical protein